MYRQIESSRKGGRRWTILALAIVIAAAGWSAFWFYAADRAKQAISGWLEREAKVGRLYSCGSQSLGGFPFRIEVRCRDADARLQNLNPPLSVHAAGIHVAAQVYQPTLLISEWTGPLTVTEPTGGAVYQATWSVAQTSLRGRPRAPERISIVLDDPVLERVGGGQRERLASGKRGEIHARIASGSLKEKPVVDLALRLETMSAPLLHPLATHATNAEIDTTLRGLSDLSPKSWPVRFREIQQAGGDIEIRTMRVRQADWHAVGAGVLRISPAGRLDGQLRVTIAGLESLLRHLGVGRLDQPSAGSEKLNSAFNALDRVVPGLGQVARQNAAPALAAGATLLGEPAELEGQRAVTLPLRFEDGRVLLGRLPVGQTPPLF